MRRATPWPAAVAPFDPAILDVPPLAPTRHVPQTRPLCGLPPDYEAPATRRLVVLREPDAVVARVLALHRMRESDDLRPATMADVATQGHLDASRVAWDPDRGDQA